MDEPAGLLETSERGGPSAHVAAIQPYGVLIVVAGPDLTIEHISENSEALTGIAARSAVGRPLRTLMSAGDAAEFEAKLREPLLTAAHSHDLILRDAAGAPVRFECGVHRRDGGGFLLELEPAGYSVERPAYTDVQTPIKRLQTAADIPALLMSAARDLRDISGFDRVAIYALQDDWQGDVVAEATAPGIDVRYLGLHFGPDEMPEQTRASFLRSVLRVVPDTSYVPVSIVSSEDAPPIGPADLARVTLRGVPPSRLAHLRNSGIAASLTISIVVRGRLWGLVTCHNAAPLRVGSAKRALCELMGHMLAWQLSARIDVERQRTLDRDTALQHEIGVALESQRDLISALVACTPQLLELFAADGIAMRIGGTFARSANVPDDVAASRIAATLLAQNAPGEIVTATSELPAVVGAPDVAIPAGALCIRLTEGAGDFLLVLRAEMVRTIVWGRAPAALGDAPVPTANTIAPWRQVIRGQCRPWSTDDIAAAEALATRIFGSLQQLARTRTEQITHVNAHLEERNAQAEALIKLQHDVAEALPSRSAVIEVILQFAQRQTRAGGSVLERLSEREIVYDAATGSLAGQVGLRLPRAGSFTGLSADLHQTLVCHETAVEVIDMERELCERLHIGSMLVVPITISANDTVVLKVVSARPFAFRDDDAQTLKLAATNLLGALRAAAEFTALASAEREQRNYARQLRALHAIASTTTSHRKDQIDAALHLGLEQVGLDWGFLGVIDHATQEFVIESSVGSDGHIAVPDGTRMPLGQTIIARVALSKRVIIVEDIAKYSEPPIYAGCNSYIAVPLFIGGANYGAIGFTSHDVRTEPFSEANIEFLAVAGELIASAIERGLQRDQLETSQARYRALIEAIPQMLWVVDARNAFEYVNERWTNYTGLSLEESRRTGRDRIYHAADVAAAGPLAEVEFDCEVRLRRADGAYRWHLVRSVPFRGEGGDVDKWLVTATDIEARKSAENLLAEVHDAALAATEAKSRFLATMSHEIRTPMNGVIGMTELLLLTALNDEQREYTEIIRDSGQSLLRVLNDILDYSKIEAGKLELETVRFDLPGQIESVVELLRPGFSAKDVKLTTLIAPDVRTAVVGDPGRLRQILLNLAGNALKFTAAGGHVRIIVTTRPGNGDFAPVRFTIKDSGIGIPPDVVDRLFQPFSQGDESTTRKYGGTGLGLSISAELVSLMEGDIGVDSVPGVGSEFWFVIPFRLAPNSQKVADTPRPLPKRSAPAPSRMERILLVEDNEINTFLALKQLGRLGFAVTAVVNGREAVDAVEREQFDLVLMDCHMPEMDGFEATRAIRKRETDVPHLPIVAMTADARDEDHQNCLFAGMDDYISKPTNLDSLRAVLDRWLPAPERRRASRLTSGALSSAPTLGMSMLLELFNNDRAAVFDLLAAALGSIGGDLKRIEAAAIERDFETMGEAAHRLKGTSGSIRSGRLVEIATAIEVEARTLPAAIPTGLLADLRAAVAAVNAEVILQRKSVESGAPR